MRKLIDSLMEASKYFNNFDIGDKFMVVEKGAYLSGSSAKGYGKGNFAVDLQTRKLKVNEIIKYTGMKTNPMTGTRNKAEHFKTKDGFEGTFKPSKRNGLYADSEALQPMEV